MTEKIGVAHRLRHLLKINKHQSKHEIAIKSIFLFKKITI